MLSEAQVIERPAQPYVAIKENVTMQTIGQVLPALHPHVFAWLGERGINPAGAPFWKFNVIEMARDMEVEVGVPIAAPVEGDEQVLAATLPAGSYATVTYTGHPDGLVDATASLLKWAEDEHLTFDTTQSPDGDRWAARLEIYETDPREEPDMAKWVTQLAFRLAD
jgi:effector-binding domain-containing protein